MTDDNRVPTPAEDLQSCNLGQFGTILADPPWQFTNRTGKMAPEHRRLLRYPTMTLDDILNLPVAELSLPQSHLYLWVPNALIAEGLEVMKQWGFTYKTNLVWYKVRKDGGPDGRGVGFYFRNVTELILFGTRGSLRTFSPGRRQVNIITSRKREHSRKPDELYDIIESCSPGPYLELFARRLRANWRQWGNEVPLEADDDLFGTDDEDRHRLADVANEGDERPGDRQPVPMRLFEPSKLYAD
jgi:N6-adenosine-specific RNA methylase IME4